MAFGKVPSPSVLTAASTNIPEIFWKFRKMLYRLTIFRLTPSPDESQGCAGPRRTRAEVDLPRVVDGRDLARSMRTPAARGISRRGSISGARARGGSHSGAMCTSIAEGPDRLRPMCTSVARAISLPQPMCAPIARGADREPAPTGEALPALLVAMGSRLTRLLPCYSPRLAGPPWWRTS